MGALYDNFLYYVLNRFNIPDEEKRFVIAFFMSGVNGVVLKRLEGDCKESVDFMVDFIYKYIKR